jgi:hypothetical protein
MSEEVAPPPAPGAMALTDSTLVALTARAGQPADAPPLDGATLISGAVQAAGAKQRVAHKKHKVDDVPDAPWLRHGRR